MLFRSHLAPGSRLQRLLATESLAVNSMHHQGIARLAPGLVPVATSPDGLIEGVEAANGQFLIGVQWPPEFRCWEVPFACNLFEAFGAACRRRAAERHRRAQPAA